MSGSEVAFWGRIVSALWRPNRVLNRVENGVVDGMPDAYLCMEGSANWVELKAPTEPRRASTPLFGNSNHKLSITQANWLLGHRQAGGRGWIAVETERWMFLCGARMADAINKMTLEEFREFSDFHCERPFAQPHWSAFESALKMKGLP